MNIEITGSLLLPVVGTSLGAGCVFFLKHNPHPALQRVLTGFAAGVMIAASVFSLLLPAIEQSQHMGVLSFVPASAGFVLGVCFLLLLDRLVPQLPVDSGRGEKPMDLCQRTKKLVFAVTLHNVPEGMAVGAACAGWLNIQGAGETCSPTVSGTGGITLSGVLILAMGIAIQNIPEGAIISMPLRAGGMGQLRSFFYGVLSGIVEPAGALLTILAVGIMTPVLPYLLGFAAGAMLFVVVKELIPEMSQGRYSDTGMVFFSLGFALMMVLDVALG